MSDHLRTLIDQLRASLLSPRHHHTFLAARQRQPVLGRYSTMRHVLTELAGESASAYPEREALTRALLAEHRGGQDSLWASALLVAYYPMLSRLRHRLVCRELARDELDQLVLASFLAVLHELPRARQHDRIALCLRRRTARAVFAVLRKQCEEQRALQQYEQLCRVAPEIIEPGSELDEQAVLLLHAARSAMAPLEGAVLVHTVLQQEQLRSYVDRTIEGDEPVRERAYQRLKRQRTRALHRMRLLVSTPSSNSDALAGKEPSTPAAGPDDSRRRTCV